MQDSIVSYSDFFSKCHRFSPTCKGSFSVVVSPNRLQGLKISGGASERRQEEITTCKRKAENRERLLTKYHYGKRKCKKAIGPRMISAVSKPIFATKYSFCSIFRDLQDYHSFAPLPIQDFSKFSSESFCNFQNFVQSSDIFHTQSSSNFAPLWMKFSRNFAKIRREC